MVGQKFARNTHLMHKNCGTIMMDKLNKIDCMIFKAHKILISKDSRRQMMESVHIRHMGVDKCLKRARDIMFCPKMSEDIIKMVLECLVCLERMSSKYREPTIVHDIPDIPMNTIFVHIDQARLHINK